MLTIEEWMRRYPDLTREQILDALQSRLKIDGKVGADPTFRDPTIGVERLFNAPLELPGPPKQGQKRDRDLQRQLRWSALQDS